MVDPQPRTLSRRAVLAGGVAALAACAPPGGTGGRGDLAPRRRERPVPVAQNDLPFHAELGGAPIHYEITGAATPFPMEAAFAARLDAAFAWHWETLGVGTPAAISSLGTWRPTPEGEDPSSWHQAGRAFDLARILGADGAELVSCRYDQWSGAPPEERAPRERAYWRTAATLHRDFAYVLTYLYDAAHHDHIHVDDGLSGEGRSEFRPGSWVQVHAVQAMCVHVWGRDVAISEDWDRATRRAVGEVLDEAGIPGRLTSPETWHAFLEATARRDAA